MAGVIVAIVVVVFLLIMFARTVRVVRTHERRSGGIARTFAGRQAGDNADSSGQ